MQKQYFERFIKSNVTIRIILRRQCCVWTLVRRTARQLALRVRLYEYCRLLRLLLGWCAMRFNIKRISYLCRLSSCPNNSLNWFILTSKPIHFSKSVAFFVKISFSEHEIQVTTIKNNFGQISFWNMFLDILCTVVNAVKKTILLEYLRLLPIAWRFLLMLGHGQYLRSL